ncbi:MAG TPA: hypothetical protein ENH62_14840 [Marinobacter sp.]|uniref:Right handed beta helix domain-containing protein n=1 Tax=marine sediment metagenome TaxID=412755 RepID=A0A0F9RH66_9ZZZZ|nr:hypothetical protein [Marinobacter sp.]
MMKCLWPIAVFLLLMPNKAMADTHAAASCSIADITTAVNAASDGDTVTVPTTGSPCTWNSALSLDLTTKGLLIQGAGRDSLTIISNTPLTDPTLELLVATGFTVTITGFTFDGDGRNNTSSDAVLNMTGTGSTHRIHTNDIINIGDRGIRLLYDGGELYVLIDNNRLYSSGVGGEQAITAFGNGDTSWGVAHTWGDANATFIEDNEFYWNRNSDSAVDGYDGARYVIRYNAFYEKGIGFHGNFTGNYRSLFSSEIYQNDLNLNAASPIDWVRVKGGSHTIYSNRATGNFRTRLFADSERSCGSAPTWGKCTGANDYDGNTAGPTGTSGTASAGAQTSMTDSGAGWSVNAYTGFYVHNTTEGAVGDADCIALIDSNTSEVLTLSAQLADSCSGDSTFANTETYVITLGYPCLDQLGRGASQAADKVYEWSNTEDGSDVDWVINDACPGETPELSDHLVIGTDLINDTQRPGYSGYIYPHPRVGGSCEVSGGDITESALQAGYEWTVTFTGEAVDALVGDNDPLTEVFVDGWTATGGGNWNTCIRDAIADQADNGTDEVTQDDSQTVRFTIPANACTTPNRIVVTMDGSILDGGKDMVCTPVVVTSSEAIAGETVGIVYDVNAGPIIYDVNGITITP